MKRNLRIITLTFLSLLGGIFAHAKVGYYSEVVNPTFEYYGKASWYSKDSPGIKLRTANNEIFDDRMLTCAMWGVPFNQLIKITNVGSGKSIIVRVNDRGPHKRYVKKGRIIDLTKYAFEQLGDLKQGLMDVQLEIL